MLFKVKQMLDEAPEPEVADNEIIVIEPEPDDAAFTIEREGFGWRVSGSRIERVAAMTYFEFDATLIRFQHILESMGISEALKKAGVKPGDMVYIGDEELEWGEE